MKSVKTVLIVLILLIAFTSVEAKVNSFTIAPPDSAMKLLTEFSLFNEYQKNKDYKSAADHGWFVINTDPTKFIKFRVFKKMETILWDFYENAATDEEKSAIADTTIYLYDKAVEFDTEKADYYYSKKGYIQELWFEPNPEEIVATYLNALEVNPDLSVDWQDRLGQVYARFADDENNDYKVDALELYSKLSEQEPDNALWLSRIEALAGGDIEILVEIKKQAWDLDSANTEKAWGYADICLRNKDYEKAIEPLKFLTEKSPEVINYWTKLAQTYQKLDRTDDAISSFKTLISLQPDNRDSYVNIAIIYQNLDQFSVARSYLNKAMNADKNWAYPYYLEGQLYEKAARSCSGGKLDFDDKLVFKLAVDTYNKAKDKEGPYASAAGERAAMFKETVPQQQDYFFRSLSSGSTVKIDGKGKGKAKQKACYSWIGKTIIVP
ncbi:MAG: tetratricopeptide repeat protein [Melioribacteraceae bacterium]|nr:tetratricopeptide repeat protein [Melioribacteraceae bacterium]